MCMLIGLVFYCKKLFKETNNEIKFFEEQYDFIDGELLDIKRKMVDLRYTLDLFICINILLLVK